MKHIGRHSDRKVAVIYKTVPDQEHMALVVHTETMGASMHDAMMKVIESPEGQQSNELADVLFRNLFPNGKPMLETLHREGMLKKVEATKIILTPNAKSSVNLGELNDILKEMASGEDAKSKLADLDANAGLVNPANKVESPSAGVLNDSTLAQQQLEQAQRMEAEAKSLIAESKLLTKEAYKLDASLKPNRKPVAKKTPSVNKTTPKAKTKA